MENRTTSFVLPSLILSLGLIICALVLGRTIIKAKGFDQIINVTGSAYKPIKSDFCTWESSINTSATTLETGYAKMKRDLSSVRKYLADKGFAENDYQVGAISLYKEHNREGVVTGYNFRQLIKFESKDIDGITAISKQSSEMIEQGIQFESYPPQYLFTGLEPLKIEMIQAATANAKLRADMIASTTDKTVGAPRSARVGVFQIRPLYSQDVSNMGMSDVSSVGKEIVCTVNISFSIE